MFNKILTLIFCLAGISLQQAQTLNDNGNWHTISYTGSAQNFTMPSSTNYTHVEFQLMGGDGGHGGDTGCKGSGGQGAEVVIAFTIGNSNANEIPLNTPIRFIVGGKGESINKSYGGGGGGGGGTAVLDVSGNHRILAVAGGGGGGYGGEDIFKCTDANGKNASLTEAGSSGSGSGDGGTNGQGGEADGVIPSGGGGGGAYSAARDSDGTSYNTGGKQGTWNGGAGGVAPSSDGRDTQYGGWGFGGGGCGWSNGGGGLTAAAGGGGGGYSGGGYGSFGNSGGGGGSYVLPNAYSTTLQIPDSNTSEDGYIKYRFVNRNDCNPVITSLTVVDPTDCTGTASVTANMGQTAGCGLYDLEYVLLKENDLGFIRLNRSGVFSNLAHGNYEIRVRKYTDSRTFVTADNDFFSISNTDNEYPKALCKDVTVYLDKYGEATLDASDVDNGSNDNCGIYEIGFPYTTPGGFFDIKPQLNLTCDDLGVQHISFVAMDYNEQGAFCSFGITVIDDLPPTPISFNFATIQEFDVEIPESGSISLTQDFFSSIKNAFRDNCTDTQNLTINSSLINSTYTCAHAGNTYSFAATVSDANGNHSSEFTIKVNIIDNTTPTVNYNQDITLSLNASGQATLLKSDIITSVSDQCISDADILAQYNWPDQGISYTCQDTGVYNYTLTPTDTSYPTLNVAVTVHDPTAITNVQVQDVTVTLNNQGLGSLSFTDLVFSADADNCYTSQEIVSSYELPAIYTIFDCNDLGLQTVTLNKLNTDFPDVAVNITVVNGTTGECVIDPSTLFVTTWKTTTTNETITIPTTGNGYNYSVDWGDGATTSAHTGNVSHTYSSAGIYTVKISGKFPRIYFNGLGDKDKIQSVTQWGLNPWSSMVNAFSGCSNIDITASDVPNLANVTSFENIFKDCTALTGTSAFNSWDVSTITSLQSAFRNCKVFDQDISSWDLSSLTDAQNMFEAAGVSKSNYDALLTGWGTDTSSTANDGIDDIPTGIVFHGGNGQYCAVAERQVLTNTNGWIITDGGTHASCTISEAFITKWRTTTANESITIPTTGTGKGYDYSVDWGDGSTKESGFTGNATHTYTAAGTYTVSITGVFPRILVAYGGDRTKLIEVAQWGDNPWTSMASAFAGCTNLSITATDAPDLSNLTSMASMFESSGVNQDISSWNVSNVTDMRNMFTFSTFNQNISIWNVGKVTNMSGMFALTPFNQNISIWNVSNVTNMAAMFNMATSFNQDLGDWDIGNVDGSGTNFSGMHNMFLSAGLSQSNYDATLIGWSTDTSGTTDDGIDDVPTGIVFHAGNSKYCAVAERQTLIDTHNWTITDGGFDASCSISEAFITKWKTTTANESITIPTIGTGYEYTVDWGDGATTESGFTGDATHTYATAGTYTVSITGVFPRIQFANGDNSTKLIEVVQWGDNPWTSMEKAFLGCKNLSISATDMPDLSNLTSMAYMFESSGVNQDISSWDVSNVTDMRNMFALTSFNQNISKWNVSNVTDMAWMFAFSSFNQNISIWNVGKVTNMSGMFTFSPFNQNISTWNVSNVTDMSGMFNVATSFNQDLSSWNVGQVINMGSMFNNATSFNGTLSSWDVSNVTNMSNMFNTANLFDQDLSSWNVSKVQDMSYMFRKATSFDQNLSGWDLSSLTMAQNMFESAGISNSNYDALLIGWSTDTSNTIDDGNDDIPTGITFHAGNSQYCVVIEKQKLTNTHNWTITDGGLHESCSISKAFITKWKTTTANESITIPTIGTGYEYTVDWGDGSALESGLISSATHTYTTAGTYTVSITGIFPQIYFNNDSDSQKLLEVTQWGDNLWKSMEGAFKGCSNLSIMATDAPDLSAVTSMKSMFESSGINQDISNWNVSNVTNMSRMFAATSFNKPLSNWNVGNVTDMSYMFQTARSFNQDISNWNVGKVTDMSYMFDSANAFNSVLANWNVSEVTNMAVMFAGTSFNRDISNWNVGKVTDMNNMFFSVTSFNQNLSNWNVSNVTNMSGMFDGARSINKDISRWNVRNVTDMSWMFRNAESFNQHLSGWDMRNVRDMTGMFFYAISFDQPIPNWNVSKVTNMSFMFAGTPFNQDLSGWIVHNVTDMKEMFRDATAFDQDLGDWDLSSILDSDASFGLCDMFKSAELSVTNYEATLLGWSTDTSGSPNDNDDDIPTGIIFNAGNSKYCAVTEKQLLINDYGWTISDGGVRSICSISKPFITKWKTTSANESITIPTTGIRYNYSVDWGDGTVETGFTGDATHSYASAGTYEVSITGGTFPQIYFEKLYDPGTIRGELRILEVTQWGDNPWRSMEGAFTGCRNLSITANDAPDLSIVTNMRAMFKYVYSLTGGLSNWNVSNVTNMKEVFSEAKAFNGDLSSWDVSKVTDMEAMFFYARVFNQDISNWNVSKVTNMNFLFNGAHAFNQDISSWNVGNVTTMWEMFNNARSFTADISGWNVSKVTNMTGMFFFTTFNPDLSEWDLSSLSTAAFMFQAATLSTENYDAMLIGWSTDSSGSPNDNIDDIPSGIKFHGGNNQYCLGAEARQILTSSPYNWQITDGGQTTDCYVRLAPKAYLQGAAMNPITGEETLMRDNLRTGNHIPLESPYGDGRTIDASVLKVTGANAIVDWVLVELRDGSSNTTITDNRSALLQRDGDIVDLDGTSSLICYQPSGNYYVAIKHRNHLGIMSNAPIALSTTAASVDFTKSSTLTYGTNSQTSFGMPTGVLGMWAGDADGDSKVNFGFDSNKVLLDVLLHPNNTTFSSSFSLADGYFDADIDLNGSISFQDEGNTLLLNVLLYPGNTTFSSSYGLFDVQLPTTITVKQANDKANMEVHRYIEQQINDILSKINK